jgi:hypothetical protein
VFNGFIKATWEPQMTFQCRLGILGFFKADFQEALENRY